MEWLVFTSIFLQAPAITISCFWFLRPGSMVKGWSGFMGGSGLSSSVNKKWKLYFSSDKKIRWQLWFLISVISFELPSTGNERASSAQGRDGLLVQSWQLWGELNHPIPRVISNHFLLIVLILCPFISIGCSCHPEKIGPRCCYVKEQLAIVLGWKFCHAWNTLH